MIYKIHFLEVEGKFVVVGRKSERCSDIEAGTVIELCGEINRHVRLHSSAYR